MISYKLIITGRPIEELMICMKSKWNLFVACMFLGLGIGMLFDHAGAGVIIGMGVGFIVEALIDRVHVERRNSEHLIQGRKVISSIILVLIGVGFILGGLHMAGLITIPKYLWRNMGAFILIAIGLGFLVAALRSLRHI